MIERARLLDLASACERPGGIFEDAIFHDVGDYLWRGGAITGERRAEITGWLGKGAALVAARELVPPGVWWAMRQTAGPQGSGNSFYIASITFADRDQIERGIGGTDALALLAAALRAMAVLMPEEQAAA